MPDPVAPFLASCFPVGTRALAPHANLVTAVLGGRSGPLRLERGRVCVEGDVLVVRPGVIHGVALAERGADVLYLNGLAFPFDAPLAVTLEGVLAHIAREALDGDASAVAELRDRLAPPRARALPPDMAAVVRAIHGDPMWRMPQDELARRLGMERTQALRTFRRATGQGFREFKLWSALQYATQQMAGGALVRTAAMDAGFADTAHLSRVFRHVFGLTPSEGIAGLAVAPVITRDRALRTKTLM
ncbi:MAG: helix-turn-helix transcriptional regulator [Sphingopyxis sp.]|uniref:AraC family transcriptional regulator n=1 Tax=Sphingopyxis sp. TaxID=1908224 RepID=UPI001A308130|nr:AraC family transcriptional regulator [Sphingopyxis sp.]MBJ7498684.1 helix-turn-helix transcriptional regulator [Sphingopyxis sp.]